MPGLNVHLYPSPLVNESRILRITAAVRDAGIFGAIEIVGVTRPGLLDRETLDSVRTLRRLPRDLPVAGQNTIAKIVSIVGWSRKVLDIYRDTSIACVNAHSLAVLPLAARLAREHGAKLIYDTHELETEVNGSRGARKLLAKITERRFIARADLVFVVSPSISDWYAKAYRISPPVVVRNIPDAPTHAPQPTTVLRNSKPIDPSSLIFIYQGGLMAGRGIERLLRVFSQVTMHHLFLMGAGPLETLAREYSARFPHIHLLPPVSSSEVLAMTSQADVGLCLTEDACLSYRYSLPNKLFEYLHAGVATVVTPLPEQQRIVMDFACGWVAPQDDHELKRLLSEMTHESIASRKATVAMATNAFSWAREKELLIESYREMFSA